MKSRRNGIFVGVVAAFGLAVFGAEAAIVTVGNGIYSINVSNSGGQIGSWNALTGAGNPAGGGRDIMYDQTTVTTNFSSLRVWGPTGGFTTYTWGGEGGGTNLDPFFVSSSASSFGTATNSLSQTWNITPANLRLTQDVIATGTTFANSAIYHTVTLQNVGNFAVSIGWRNLYDWAVNDPGFQDGPGNQIELNGGGVLVPFTTSEFAFTPVAGSFARVSRNPFGTATYEPLLGLGFDPGFIAGLPVTVPTEYDFARWPNSVGTAFDYTTIGASAASDSAGLSWFGRDLGTAYTLDPGQTIRFTQAVYGVPPGEEPPGGGGTVPEPGTLALLSLGVLGLGFARRRESR